MKIYTENKIDSGSVSPLTLFFLSIVGGVLLAFIVIFGMKALFILLGASYGFVREKWYYLVGGLIALILLKKFFGKKKIEVSHADPY